MYSATLGRFLQRDPAGYVDGMCLYAYVMNNPLKYLDAWGLMGVFSNSSLESYKESKSAYDKGGKGSKGRDSGDSSPSKSIKKAAGQGLHTFENFKKSSSVLGFLTGAAPKGKKSKRYSGQDGDLFYAMDAVDAKSWSNYYNSLNGGQVKAEESIAEWNQTEEIPDPNYFDGRLLLASAGDMIPGYLKRTEPGIPLSIYDSGKPLFGTISRNGKTYYEINGKFYTKEDLLAIEGSGTETTWEPPSGSKRHQDGSAWDPSSGTMYNPDGTVVFVDKNPGLGIGAELDLIETGISLIPAAKGPQVIKWGRNYFRLRKALRGSKKGTFIDDMSPVEAKRYQEYWNRNNPSNVTPGQ